MKTGPTRLFAEWASKLTFDAIPPEVVDHAKYCILDTLGCALFGSTQPWGRIATEVAAEQSPGGRASLWGGKMRVGVADAAFVNGTSAHGFEIDDVHLESLMHPGSVTVPAAWALAETRGAGGAALVAAVVAGYEIGLRVGIATGVPHMLRGFHPTGTVGCICSSVAAANLLQLSPEPFTHALAIGATQAAGIYSASRTGAMVKRMHAGRAAQSGVLAAILAEKGFTGSAVVLEDAPAGFMATLAEGSDLTFLTLDLGSRWQTREVGFKAYAACASAHTIVDALDALMREGLRHSNLGHLQIRLSKIGMNNVGWRYQPAGVTAAQMNGYYAAAVKLIDGEAFIDQYQESRLADPQILALIQKMDIAHDPELDRGGAATRHAVSVEAQLLDGKVLQRYVEQRRGSVEHPLSKAELEEKFRRTAAEVLPAASADELLGGVLSLDQIANVDRLCALARNG